MPTASSARATSTRQGVVHRNEAELFPRGKSLTEFRKGWHHADLEQRIRIEREGVPWYVAMALSDALGVSASELQRLFRIPPATYKKKIAGHDRFTGAVGQSMVEIMDLINTVDDLLEPGHPEVKGFDPEQWLGEWIRKPQPGLGGRRPAELLDTPTGRQQVMRLLGATASGAYL